MPVYTSSSELKKGKKIGTPSMCVQFDNREQSPVLPVRWRVARSNSAHRTATAQRTHTLSR